MDDVEKLLNNEVIKQHLEEIKKWNEDYLKRVNKKSELLEAKNIIKEVSEDVKRKMGDLNG